MSQDRWWKRLTLSITQFNVLAAIYEPRHIREAAWTNRSQQVLSQLRWSNSDVICLQEANPISFYHQHLANDYDILFVSKSDSGAAQYGSGFARKQLQLQQLQQQQQQQQQQNTGAGGEKVAPGNNNVECGTPSSVDTNNTNGDPQQNQQSASYKDNSSAASGSVGTLPAFAAAAAGNSRGATPRQGALAFPGGGGGGSSNGDGAVGANDDPNMTLHDMRNNLNDSDDGAALLFKRGSVDVISCTRILLQEPITENDSTLHPGPRRARQFALFAHALHIASKKTFFVCAVHMKANGERSEDWRRVCHLKQIFQRIAQLRAVDAAAPLFFTGDLNADPQSMTMEMLQTGRTTYNGTPHFTGQAAMSSAMKDMCDGSEPQFTILDSSHGNGPWWSILDYILYEKERATPIAFLTPPTLEDWQDGDAIKHCGSDHIPIVCEFVLGKLT